MAAELFGRAASVRSEDYQAKAIESNMYEALHDEARAKKAASETVELAHRAVELNPADSRAMILGASYQLILGNREEAIEWAAMAQEADPNSNGVAYNSACILAKMGEHENALDQLERAVELGSRNKAYFETDVDFESIREHPRFIALMEKI